MERLKVLIVDDEYLIRNLLKRRINWEELGMAIVGEASNAREALDMVEALKPDIIFTDICMPSIDGIEFSGMVIEKNPEIKIVIVTGHDEFEFARKSIKLGIADFILKPINSAEILSVTERLKKKILEERTRNKEFEKLKEELKKNFPVLIEKFLNRWIQQPLTKDEIEENLVYFGIPFCNRVDSYQLAVLEISLPLTQQTEENAILLSMKCRKRAEEYFQDMRDLVILTDNKNQIVILSGGDYNDFTGACELLKTNFINSYKCYACIGISNRHKNLANVHLGYQEAYQALRFKAIIGKNQLVCYEDVIESGELQYRSNPQLLEELHFSISAGSADHAIAVIKKILQTPLTQVSQLRLAAMDIFTKCQYAAIEHGIDGGSTAEKEAVTTILLSDNLPELQKSLEAYILRLAGSIDSKITTKADDLIIQVKDYLEKNMADPELGLANTAAAFFVSPGHLGRIMKKETGQTFVEYLTGLRIHKAELLLKTTELKGYQIGEMVGITDPHYFSILFKKNLGVSVNEYRNDKNSMLKF
jgi:two-component system, response regulator YesN